MNQVAPIKDTVAEIVEAMIVKGDLRDMTPDERSRYYLAVCNSVGLNPLTRPFDFIVLNGRLILYALRGAADQLRKIHSISIEIISQKIDGPLLTVHVRAIDKNGRKDEDYGVVVLGNLQGEARANTILKGITKAKRRVTLSLCGLGMLDETEVDDIPAEAKAPEAKKSTSVRDLCADDIKEMGGLSEKEMRDLYMALLADMKKISPEHLAQWAADAAERIGKLPMGWQGTLKRNIAKRTPVANEADQTEQVVWEENGIRPATAADRPARLGTLERIEEAQPKPTLAEELGDGIPEFLRVPVPADIQAYKD